MLDCTSFASLTLPATFPQLRSGAKARKPWEASRAQKPLKKSFNPHQACKTSTPPRGFSGNAKYPVALPVSVLNSTFRPVCFKVGKPRSSSHRDFLFFVEHQELDENFDGRNFQSSV